MKKRFKLNLRLFDEGTGASAAPTVGQASGETVNSDAGNMNGETKTVVYGIQDDAGTVDQSQPATENTTPDPEARKAEFEKLISGDYKDLFSERTQDIINKRFKDVKATQKQLDEAKKVLDLIGTRYNIIDGDISKISKAVQEDASLFEIEAMKQGLTVEQLMYQKNIERENQQLKQTQQETAQKQEFAEKIQNWDAQQAQIQKMYPGINWRTEADHPETGQAFWSILNATGNLKYAFDAIHHDQMITSGMYVAAEKSREATVKTIQSRNSRPSENGTSSQPGVIVKSDVNSMSYADIKAAAEEAKKGKTIRF